MRRRYHQRAPHEERSTAWGLSSLVYAVIAAQTAPGEVLVSSTVKDLVAGSGIAFEDRGQATFKRIPDHWRLFKVPERPTI